VVGKSDNGDPGRAVQGRSFFKCQSALSCSGFLAIVSNIRVRQETRKPDR